MPQPTVRMGERGAAVRQLQGLIGARADGVFGRRTEVLLAEAQRGLGLLPDGVCGPLTWEALGWLPDVERLGPTPHRYHLGRRPNLIQPPEAVVLHYTASPRGPGPYGADYDRIARWAAGGPRVSSTHLVVLRDGRVIQMAPLYDRAWHAPFKSSGRLVNALEIEGEQLAPNSHALGVDLESVGWLKRQGGDLINAYGGRYTGPTPFYDERGRPWEPPTPPQLDALARVLAELGRRLPVLASSPEARVVGHSEINHRGGRVDPGPALSMAWAREQVARGERSAR